MKLTIQHPITREDWRHAATLAETMLDIDCAQRYGLMAGGPAVDVARCTDIVRQARRLGIVPRSDDVHATTKRLLAEWQPDLN